jgi:hypothetical protein
MNPFKQKIVTSSFLITGILLTSICIFNVQGADSDDESSTIIRTSENAVPLTSVNLSDDILNVIVKNDSVIQNQGLLEVSKKEILAGKESAEVYFYFQVDTDSNDYKLYQNGEFVANLVDTGKYAQDGDDIQGDGVYSAKFTVDVSNSNAKLTYNVKSGDTVVSNEVTINVIKPFSEKDIADMAYVDETLNSIIETADFKNSDVETRLSLIEPTIQKLIEDGYLLSYSVEREEKCSVSFIYSCNVNSEIIIKNKDIEYSFLEDEVLICAETGIIPEGANFEVLKIMPPPADVTETVENHYGADVTIIGYYEITLKDYSGVLVTQLDGYLTISIKLPEEYTQSTDLSICHIDEQNQVIELESWIEGERILFKTNQL